MIDFPNCKVNMGLNVLRKREDGYHDIETVFYPVQWCDALEIIVEGDLPISIKIFGNRVEGSLEENIIYKAWLALKTRHSLPNITVYLHKNLPMGAGLGGGSSDAAFFLKMMNQKFKLLLSDEELLNIARQLGSDCAFFIENKPVLGSGKGDEFTLVNLNLMGYYILIVYPKLHSNTKEAYESIVPVAQKSALKTIIETEPIENWKNCLFNDFEISIFKKYPAIQALKNTLYKNGAIYASLSGSGSAVFGLFQEKPQFESSDNFIVHISQL